MSLFDGRSGLFVRNYIRAICAVFVLLCATVVHAGVIRGTVTDTTGATVKGASVVLFNGGKYVSTTVSTADGTFQFVTGRAGRFTLVITAASFHQLDPPFFYAGANDNVERNLVMEPEWVHQSIVVTATGTPIAQQQTSVQTDVFSPLDLARREDVIDILRLQPGAVVTQLGQRGAQTSLFIRGGDSNAAKVLFDGVNVDEMGGIFDYGNTSATGIQSTEVYRGPNSSLYGSDAASGVVNFVTPRGLDSHPQLTFNGDLGNLHTARNQLELEGSHNKLDYYGAYSWLQSENDLPMDRYHLGTAVGNFGWQPTGNLRLLGTGRWAVAATGVPNAWNFYGIADDRKQSDQNLYIGGSADYQMTADFHNQLRYGAVRKREQSQQWYPAGICIPAGTCDGDPDPNVFAGNWYGNDVTIRGANGTQVVGQAILNYSTANFSTYPNRLDLVTNRDQVHYEGDFRFTPHLVGLIGFNYENERGAEREPVYFLDDASQRNNYDYLAEVHGDFKGRLFYTLGGSLQRYQIIGTQTSPRFGVSYYALKPRRGIFNGTRLSFNFAQAVREPTLADQFGSLYTFLENNGGDQTVQQLHIHQVSAPTARTWEGGVEQGFASERVIVHVNFFHNEFGRQIEGVGVGLIPALLPQLTAAQQQQLESTLNSEHAFSLDINSEAFRALGVESTVEAGFGHSFFVKGGYTYLDTVVQHSFSSDNETLLGIPPTTFANTGIPLGIYSPLKGARPFRRPPHTGFVSATFSAHRWVLASTAAFSSRSDDSTFLGFMDLNQGNSLLLPNRNLDYGYAKIDFGGSFQLLTRLAIYGQAENLTNDQHIAPIGYPSLPFNFRMGLRVEIGKGQQK